MDHRAAHRVVVAVNAPTGLDLARDIAYGCQAIYDGWYGADEARVLADEVLRLHTLLRMGAVGGESEEIRAWCRLALSTVGEEI